VDLAVAATTLGLVVLAELPDKTSISCLVLSSRHRQVPVWVGAVSALILQARLAVVVGVLAGHTITRWVPLSTVRRLSGLALLGFGIDSVVSLTTS
jgi:putative Ca2+/H+ antiporter (TMEM165/GDT1 family)